VPASAAGGDAGANLLAADELQASASGVQENVKDAWFWSGSLEATVGEHDISYQVASLKRWPTVGRAERNP